MLAIGAPCLIMGVALEGQLTEIIQTLNSSLMTERVSSDVEWARSTFWFGTYFFWAGLLLMLTGGTLNIVRIIYSGNTHCNVDNKNNEERYLNP